MKFFSFFLLALLAVATANDVKQRIKELREMQTPGREGLIQLLSDRHDRRMLKVREMLKDRKTQLEDHNSGRRLLSGEDHARVLRQVTNFERKLRQMTITDPEEHRRMLETEADAYHRMNSIDYIDFDAKN